jgi:hypothetical protein
MGWLDERTTSEVGLFLLEACSSLQLAAITDFTGFASAAGASVAVFNLISSAPAAAQAVLVRYVLDLGRRGVPLDQQRLYVDALADVTARAQRFAIATWRLDVDQVLLTASQTPQRPLRANGGDRRSVHFQCCDRSLPRGTVAYFRARLQRDRPDLWAAYERGAYSSTRQAAIAAGFLRPAALAGVTPRRVSKQNKRATRQRSEEGITL